MTKMLFFWYRTGMLSADATNRTDHRAVKHPHSKQLVFYTAVFILSGFAGLIYESIWTHYLKLLLGHAAWAQTLVLVIFMGGMALGAWIASKLSHRIGNLLAAYAIVEGIIGIMALGFDVLYGWTTHVAYESILPFFSSPTTITLIKWGVASALILPQSILLGVTFPLMTGGVIRKTPNCPGHVLSNLYFGNSLGAAVGILASGFVLIRLLGLPGTIMVAGAINVVLACIVWVVARRTVSSEEDTVSSIPPPNLGQFAMVHADDGPGDRRIHIIFLGCAGLTGLASFLYEIAWIRMLSLVLGASTHSFELMLSAFILGLAIGGFIIRNRVDSLKDTVRTLALVQLAMGTLAALTTWLVTPLFDLMGFFMSALARTNQGYLLFNVASHLVAGLVMLPATIFAGMTLPLLTAFLVRRRFGETAIGQVYAANTVGAIVAVVVAVQVIMPLLGLKNLILIGAGLDILIGVYLLWRFPPVQTITAWRRFSPMAGALGVLLLCHLLVTVDYQRTASGVFRRGRDALDIGKDAMSLFHKDGKTATVDVLRDSIGQTVIKTNGKTDAAAFTDGRPSADMPTMAGLAGLPYALHPTAKTAAVIGMGSGITAATLLLAPDIERVDIIEIESAIVDGARHFGQLSQAVFTDSRAHIHIEDAKAFFMAHRATYDIVISEPSNPWVSGVSGLFSQEFYRHIREFVAPSGVFVQWFPLYEISDGMVASIIKALETSFPHYQLYRASNADVIIVAGERMTDAVPVPPWTAHSPLGRHMAAVDMADATALRNHFIGDHRLLHHWAAMQSVPAHSDFFPFLDGVAVRARFTLQNARSLVNLCLSQSLIGRHLLKQPEPPLPTNASSVTTHMKHIRRAAHVYGHVVHDRLPPSRLFSPEQSVHFNNWRHVFSVDVTAPRLMGWLESHQNMAAMTLPYLSRPRIIELLTTVIDSPGFALLPREARVTALLDLATAKGDAEAIVTHATALIGAPYPFSIATQQKLVERAMLGRFLLADFERVDALFHRYTPVTGTTSTTDVLRHMANRQRP